VTLVTNNGAANCLSRQRMEQFHETAVSRFVRMSDNTLTA
jgi:hypothetical protein